MIETLFAAFAVGTIGFWALMIVTSILFIALIENEHYALEAVILTLLAIAYWKPLTTLDWQMVAVGIAIYMVVGAPWSAWRWKKYVKAKIKEYTLSDGTVQESNMCYIKLHTKVYSNKSRIIAWMVYWPWSMFWNILGDFFTMVYDSMAGIYQKITDNALGNIKIKPEVKNNRNLDDR